jgi:SAM-dependent methyltransferase
MKSWSAMYQNVCGSRRLLEGNIMSHAPFVAELARLVKSGDRVLEVGAGTGVLAWPLAQGGIKVVSLDNDTEVLWMAGINCAVLGADIELREGDAFHLPFEADSFELAYSHGLLEHFSDEQIHQLLAEQFRVAPVVMACVPLEGCKGIAFGNERWMSVKGWEDIIGEYSATNVFTYMDKGMLSITMVRDGQRQS